MKKRLAGDFVYTFSALLTVNLILQVIIYPLINRFYSAEALGDIVYYSGIIYTVSASVGGAISNQKLLLREKYDKTNSDFNTITVGVNIVIFIALFIMSMLSDNSILNAVLYAVSGCLVFMRYYAEVEFRLTKNFKGYLYYYLFVSAGYLIGFGFYLLTGLWYFIFIIGEALALIYVTYKGSIFKREPMTGEIGKIAKLVIILTFSYLLGALAVHYYKIFLKLFINGEAVTVYYIASFFGKSLDLVITPITTLMISYLTTKDGKKISLTLKHYLPLSLLAGTVLYIGFIIATPIYCRLLYPNLYNEVMQINFIVNIAQSLSVVSSILIVIILIQYGTKSHFGVQATFVVLYLAATTLFTYYYGLKGFGIGAIIGFASKLIMIILTSIKGEKKNV